MPPFPPSYPLYAGLCGGATLALPGTYFYKLTAPSRNYQPFSYHATSGYEDSLAFTLLNPRRFSTEQDCFSLWIAEGDLRAPGMSNEEIVARSTRGFFGGWVFTLRRSAGSFG